MISIVIIFGLATWRVSSLLVSEAGPFHIFEKIREIAGIQHDQDGKVMMVPDKLLAGVLSCVWCCSVWIAFGLFVFFMVFPMGAILFASALSVSAVAIVFDRFVNPT